MHTNQSPRLLAKRGELLKEKGKFLKLGVEVAVVRSPLRLLVVLLGWNQR
jgi:hypothetical protein